MSWNYRVIRERHEAENPALSGTSYTIREVFYDDANGRPTGTTEEPCHPSGETPEELAADFVLMKGAFDLPPLEEVNGKLVPA
jgi:hypothetical protein